MKTVLCHGVFDVLHVGHLKYLQAAKKLGRELIVSVTEDRYVNKGPGRPHFNEKQRMEMLRGLACVDRVVLTADPSAIPAIEYFKPDFYVKGPDYANAADDVTGKIRAEIAAVEKHGGKFVALDTEVHSSSALINRFFADYTEDQRNMLDTINHMGGMGLIRDTLNRCQKLRVDVIGECIKDIYRFVRPQGISSKSPSISSQFLREESYRGGSWAIAAHLRDFCKVRHVQSDYVHQKVRYISEETGQRMFEVCTHPEETEDIKMSLSHPPPDLLVVADFGHGLFKGNLEWYWPTALNVQTNSSNYGFNLFHRHKGFRYLTVDLRELRLAYQDRTSSVEELGRKAWEQFKLPISVTVGPEGSILFHKGQTWSCPAFTDRVVDATGAGDAYFALTSLLTHVDADPRLTVFLGNVFAGLKTKILGNKDSVSKASLLKACEALLKV